MNNYYSNIASFGDQLFLDYIIQDPEKLIQWTEDNFEYVRYNPRKDVARYGLSITSLDGGLSGRPDLDSLTEYNKELGNFNNFDTYIKESDLDVPTPVCDHPEIKKIYEMWKQWIYRTHIIRLDPGGFFPYHTDHTNEKLDSFRLIVPLLNTSERNSPFLIEDRLLRWEPGRLYWLNTAKRHCLFNASFDPSYWMVLNILCDRESAYKVISMI